MTFDLTTLKVTDGQRALAAYIRQETGKQVKPEQISLIDALRAEFRKDPKRVEEREAVRAAARQRKQAQLDKALAKARALAESLGMDLSALDEQPASEPSPQEQKVVEDASVTPIAKARAKRDSKAAKTKQVAAATPAVVVEPAADPDDDFDFPEEDGSPIDPTPADTSAIDVMQAEDGWEADASSVDFDDDIEDF